MPDLGALLHAFAADEKLKLVLVLIALDFVLGVSAALRNSTFRLAYVSDFARTDLLGKVFPWFIIYSADKVASANLLGTDVLAVAAGATFAGVTAALLGSLTSSVAALGAPLPLALAGGEKATPVVAPVVEPAPAANIRQLP